MVKILYIFITILISDLALAKFPNKLINNNNFFLINNSTVIGIVDFRKILKESSTMKKIGNEFLKLEKKLNEKIISKEVIIREQEKNLLNLKDSVDNVTYNVKKKEIKQRITNFQKFAFREKNKLKISFQNVQKKLKNILASIIREISKNKDIDIVLLKENAFLYNNPNLNFTNEALRVFDEKTKKIKITIINAKKEKN